LKELGIKDISVFISYFIGARSDRKFIEGGCNYIKDVISPIINLQGYSSVRILDPHSDVIEACINNFKKMDNLRFAKKCIEDIMSEYSLTREDLTIISPDAGALKKIYSIAEANMINDVVVASKHRDITTGKIVSTNVPLDMTHSNKTFVIFDDICDGGRTFIEIAKAVRERFSDSKIFLFVTHGIFSNGLGELSKYFCRIYSTNSYSNIESGYTIKSGFLKQFNVLWKKE
jgi:ribose-phosphate pyrophosphokinase